MVDNDFQSPVQQGGRAAKETKVNPSNNRRKHRKKLKVITNGTDNISPNIPFLIRPILKPEFGLVIRQKQIVSTVSKINIQEHIPCDCEYFAFHSNMQRIPCATPLQSIVQQVQAALEQKTPKRRRRTPRNKAKKEQVQEPSSMNAASHPAASSRMAPVEQPSPQPAVEKKKKEVTNKQFPGYISREEALAGVKDGTLIQGVIRINSNNYTDAFCANSDRSEPDYYINNLGDRNRALEGDVVALRMQVEPDSGDKKRLSTVVHIFEYVHPRVAAGYVSLLYQNNKQIPVFTPRDKRFPRMNIVRNLPPNFAHASKKYENTLFMAQLQEWDNPRYGYGIIIEKLGESGNLKAESRAILVENCIHFEAFPPEALEYLPTSYELSDAEIASRLDLRDECVFTIDPLTARDLDDAVHVKALPNGNFEVGVHIADVTHYLHEDTLLDRLVAQRATTTYLVDNVYHMLPKELCMSCSLLPGRDCPAFSVIWEMTHEGEVVTKRFARSVINNCVQLAYEHAQWMIMHPDATSWHIDLPEIHRYTTAEIHRCVLMLHTIAQHMRRRRYDNGALHISQTKLAFTMDAAGKPNKYYEQEIREANNLIEEFMLQANITVAEKIYHVFPELAFLRCHDEANPRMITMVRDRLEMIGIHVNIDSSREMHESIQRFKALGPAEYSKYVAINHMFAKPMTRAQYFCASGKTYGDFYHFALSIPIYTHFTSPIRRYADVVVHRLLAASLGLQDPPGWTTDRLSSVASNCNIMKFNAKKAGEASCELMLAEYVECHQPFNVEAVVVQVFEKCFEVLVLITGTVVRLFTDEMENVKVEVETVNGPENLKMNKLIIHYAEEAYLPACFRTIDLFQVVIVSLSRKPKSIKLRGTLLRPGFPI